MGTPRPAPAPAVAKSPVTLPKPGVAGTPGYHTGVAGPAGIAPVGTGWAGTERPRTCPSRCFVTAPAPPPRQGLKDLREELPPGRGSPRPWGEQGVSLVLKPRKLCLLG